MAVAVAVGILRVGVLVLVGMAAMVGSTAASVAIISGVATLS